MIFYIIYWQNKLHEKAYEVKDENRKTVLSGYRPYVGSLEIGPVENSILQNLQDLSIVF